MASRAVVEGLMMHFSKSFELSTVDGLKGCIEEFDDTFFQELRAVDYRWPLGL